MHSPERGRNDVFKTMAMKFVCHRLDRFASLGPVTDFGVVNIAVALDGVTTGAVRSYHRQTF